MLTVTASRPLPRAGEPWCGLGLAAVHAARLTRGQRLVELGMQASGEPLAPGLGTPRAVDACREPLNTARLVSDDLPRARHARGSFFSHPRARPRAATAGRSGPRASSADARESYPCLGDVVRSLPVALGPRSASLAPIRHQQRRQRRNFQSHLKRKEPTDHESRHE